MSNHPRPYHRVQIVTELRRSERALMRRAQRASLRLGLARVPVRAFVLMGISEQLERLRGECVRRGIDFEQLMRESSDPGSVDRIDAPPARLDGFADDPSS